MITSDVGSWTDLTHCNILRTYT